DETVQVQSVWDFIVKGGPVMIPIALCSVAALAVMMERLVSLQRRNVIPPGFLPGLRKTLARSLNNVDEALAYCRSKRSPLANVLAAGLKRIGEPVDVRERHI